MWIVLANSNSYKLLVSDIDGTLINNRQELITVNKKKVKELMQQGLLFTLASGRKFSSAEKYILELGIGIPLILYNGAQLISPAGKVVFEKKLDYSQAKAALELYKDYGIDALVYCQDEVYVEKINKVIEEYQIKDGIDCTAVGNLTHFIQGDVIKLLFIGEPDKLFSYAQGLKNIIGSQVNLVNSEGNYLELLPTGVSKGEALLKLAEILQIKLEEIITIGDNLNDLEMIKMAGLGVATANAHSDLLQAADYITDRDNQEGSVAEVINRFMINK